MRAAADGLVATESQPPYEPQEPSIVSTAFKGPLGHGEQIRQPPLMKWFVPGSLNEKIQKESTSIGRPQTLKCQCFVVMVSMVGEVESVAHL